MLLIDKKRKLKYKIYLKGDLSETPIIFNNKKMLFLTKVTMKYFFNILNKDPVLEYEWSEI